MARSNSKGTGGVLLSDLKDQLQKDYIEERRNELLPARAPGREVLAAAGEASKVRGWRHAVSDLSLEVGSLHVDESPQISSRSAGSRQSTTTPKSKRMTTVVSSGMQKFRRTVTNMRRCMRVVKAFSRRQHIDIRIQDNLAKRHIYGVAKDILDDVYSPQGTCHGIADVFQAIACATRQVLLMRRVSEVLGAYLAERRARVCLTKIAQDHLKLADWGVFEHNLDDLRAEMETSRVHYDGMADISTYANIVQMMLDDIAKHRQSLFDADRFIRSFEITVDVSKQALQDAENLIDSAMDGIDNMRKILTFLGGCTGKRVAAADELSGFRSIKDKEAKIMADLPEDSLSKIKAWLDDFDDDNESEELCKNELLKIGVEKGDVGLIVSAVRREKTLENVTPIMQQYSAELTQKLEELRELTDEVRKNVGKRCSLEAERKNHRVNAERLWDDLIASFQPPSLLKQASRLTALGFKDAMEDGLGKFADLQIEYKSRKSVSEAKRRLSVVAADALVKHNYRRASRRHSTLAWDAEGTTLGTLPPSSLEEHTDSKSRSAHLQKLLEAPQPSSFSVTPASELEPVSEVEEPVSSRKLCIAGYEKEEINGVYTESSEIHNGNSMWVKLEPAEMIVYTNDSGRWAVASRQGMEDDDNFMVTDMHGGKLPIDSNWYSSKGGDLVLLENVSSRTYVEIATSRPLSQASGAQLASTAEADISRNINRKDRISMDVEFSTMEVEGDECAKRANVAEHESREPEIHEKAPDKVSSARQCLDDVRQCLLDVSKPVDKAHGIGARDHWFRIKPDSIDQTAQDARAEASAELHEDSNKEGSQENAQLDMNQGRGFGLNNRTEGWPYRFKPLDNVVASRLNLRTPLPKALSMSPRRRPAHIFKERMNVESVMYDRNRRGHVHGQVLLDPWSHDEKRTQLRRFQTCW